MAALGCGEKARLQNPGGGSGAGYSWRTAKAYRSWVVRLVKFHGLRHPGEMGAREVSAFLNHLAVERKVAASTQNQALAALLFLYRHVLGVDLPWLECCRLRVKDLDFDGLAVTVREAKGGRERQTLRPPDLVPPLRRHLASTREQWEADLAQGAGWVELPGAFGRKAPNAGREWPWRWLFPATRIYRHPETGQRRPHHLHETVLQREVRGAARESAVARRVGCHTLRHSFATHLLRQGPMGVPSPLQGLLDQKPPAP